MVTASSGYIQVVAPMILGKPPAIFREMVELSRACFDAVLGTMKPGATFGELQDVYAGLVERAGNGRFSTGIPLMHARGLGDDGPALLRRADLDTYRKIPLEEGMTFILKPRIVEVDGKERTSIGDTVAVTATGAKRLGRRPLELLVLD